MSVRSHITDIASKETASVHDRALLGVELPFPPFGIEQKTRVFRQFLTADGTASGSNDMTVDGSSTPVEFWIEADDEVDTYIRRLSFVIADASADNNQFGNITALSNGCDLEYEDEEGVVTIADGLTTNFSIVRLCSGEPAFGSTTNTFRASNVSGSSEAYIPVLDLIATFGFMWGVKLSAGTAQKIVFRVNDNISALDQVDIIAYGFTRRK